MIIYVMGDILFTVQVLIIKELFYDKLSYYYLTN